MTRARPNATFDDDHDVERIAHAHVLLGEIEQARRRGSEYLAQPAQRDDPYWVEPVRARIRLINRLVSEGDALAARNQLLEWRSRVHREPQARLLNAGLRGRAIDHDSNLCKRPSELGIRGNATGRQGRTHLQPHRPRLRQGLPRGPAPLDAAPAAIVAGFLTTGWPTRRAAIGRAKVRSP